MNKKCCTPQSILVGRFKYAKESKSHPNYIRWIIIKNIMHWISVVWLIENISKYSETCAQCFILNKGIKFTMHQKKKKENENSFDIELEVGKSKWKTELTSKWDDFCCCYYCFALLIFLYSLGKKYLQFDLKRKKK